MKNLTFAILVTIFLSGCAGSTTKSNFDCPVQDGIPSCLNTSEVDNMGPIPKSATGANTDPEKTLDVKTKKTSSIELGSTVTKKEKAIVVEKDPTYKVQPLIYQPLRKHGSLERMWFASWEDREHDLFIDQQFVYWTEKGKWTVESN